MQATHPAGRGRVKLQVQACPSDVPFGHASCTSTLGSSWTDVTATSAGVTLTEPRRERVLDICERAGLLVVEDDPYGQLGFEQEPPPPLRARRRHGVFYLGTFSKTFAPGFRVGWVLAPHAVRDKLVIANEAQILCRARSLRPQSPPAATMPWREQLKTYREIYRERRDALLGSLADLMPADMTWTRPAGGLFVWATLPAGLDSRPCFHAPSPRASPTSPVPGSTRTARRPAVR
jgi:DNA-binding transcriptional MocR family regulator